ncbi:MAG TPA: sigma-54-dependent Fis family transcriptional regulator [Thiolapillus brandeum]|uniref:Sigma-54-dependent Fis family transcriptional regulator n=1 Tax=Thiolapillus brandeum TaxID=1076588 RepID=A0A831RZY7_9GAMM|nr:sigma-54-dependent Fis family transcriptional regulator [Thiolapillus brandeum]
MTTLDEAFIGNSPEFLAVQRSAKVVAATDVTVLITGETGTGKELLAKTIHRASKRNDTAFITLNCAALPDNLIESELFGYRKGAFTGADRDHTGWVKKADGGTLFLDEIGELPLTVQAKLLRFLESGEFQPVGQAATEKVDARIIAATNQDLYGRVQAGDFRADLYYRLHVVPLELPPLRERGNDIALLITELSEQLARKHQLDTPSYTPAAMNALQSYHWPGNVRELRNVCERLVILFSGKTIDKTNLPHEIRDNSLRKRPSDGFTLPDSGICLDELEASMIHQALDKARGNQSRAAKLLGVTRSTLIYRMKKFAIQ